MTSMRRIFDPAIAGCPAISVNAEASRDVTTEPRNEPTKDVLVRCASHRARARLFARLGRKPQAVWAPNRGSNYGVFRIREDELPRARIAKGVSRIRGDADDWLECV